MKGQVPVVHDNAGLEIKQYVIYMYWCYDNACHITWIIHTICDKIYTHELSLLQVYHNDFIYNFINNWKDTHFLLILFFKNTHKLE